MLRNKCILNNKENNFKIGNFSFKQQVFLFL